MPSWQWRAGCRAVDSGVAQTVIQRPANLLLVTDSLGCGGSERQMVDMADFWASRGARVTLATWSGPSMPDFYAHGPGVARVHLGPEGAGFLPQVRRVRTMRSLLRELRPDAVLSFLPRSNVPTLLAGLGLDVRIVVSERAHPRQDTSLTLPWRMLRRLSYARADAVVSQTRTVAAWIHEHWGHAPCVIPNALRVLPPPAGPRENVIVGVGRLVRQKGFDLLLEAFAGIAPVFPGWRLAILGEGPERRRLAGQCAALGLAERVQFPGRVRDAEQWMARAGLVVQPSRFEGFPNAVLEAMAMGAPVISADCPAGPADIIEDGRNGCLVPVEDPDALARAMKRLLADAPLRERLGNEAMSVRERFRQEPIMEKWQSTLIAA